MSQGRVAGSGAPNSHRAQGALLVGVNQRRLQAYRCRELCLAQGRSADGRQRGSAETNPAACRRRNHRDRRKRARSCRAIATNAVTTLGYPCSISATFLRRNQNQTPEESLATLRAIKATADQAGLGMVAYVSMAFGNPYGDAWTEEKLRQAMEQLIDIGVPAISLADTVGIADPDLIGRVVEHLAERYADCELGVHLHSIPAQAEAKVLAAYDAGCRR